MLTRILASIGITIGLMGIVTGFVNGDFLGALFGLIGVCFGVAALYSIDNNDGYY